MRRETVCYWFSFVTLCAASWEITFTGRHGLFDRFDDICKGNRNNIWRLHFGKKSLENNVFKLSTYSSDISRDITGVLAFRMRVIKCKSRDNPDTCEDFYHFDSKKMCSLIKNSKWAGLYNTVGNNFTCPLKAGHYDFTEIEFDLNSFPFFPIGGLFWRGNLAMYNPANNEEYACLNIETTVNFIKK